MSQMSGLSDLISDVDTFLVEAGIEEDVGHLLNGTPNGNIIIANTSDDEDIKVPNEDYICYPPEEPSDLATEEYSGPCGFEVLVMPSEQKAPWEFSAKLNKVFVGINLKFPVAFALQSRPSHTELFIRATPVFSQSQYFSETVQRCIGHQHPQDPSNKDLAEIIFQHVIRCSNKNTKYFGTKQTRLSIVVPLGQPQTGTEIVKEFFHFVCANSCPQGMNRRPIHIVFTLETNLGEIIGRRIMSVRVCSCPKRDKDKEEKDMEKNSRPPRGKRLRTDEGKGTSRDFTDSDTKVYQVQCNVAGKNNYLRVLKAARDSMANEIIQCAPKDEAVFKKCFKEVCQAIDRAEQSEQ